jgi:uncharacterized protein (TIGR02271 family)
VGRASRARAKVSALGHFNRRSNAEAAVDELEQDGFTHAQISLAVRPEYDANDTQGPSYSTGHELGQKTGSVWNKIVNFFEGHTAGDEASHTAPTGMTVEIANTPAAGYDSTAADRVNGGYDYNYDEFPGSLNQLNVSHDHARYFGHHFSQGEEGAIVIVNAPDRVDEAEQILERHSSDIGRNAADFEYPTTQPTPSATAAQGAQRIQLLGEILRVHKDRVQRGEVTLRKNIVTESQTFQVPIEREELVITRTPVAGRAAVTTGTIGDENEIRIPLSEGHVRVTKGNTILEKVFIGKREVTDSQTVNDSVRHEELSVDENRTNAGFDQEALPAKSRL